MDDLISRQAAIDRIGAKADEIYEAKMKGATFPHGDFFQGMSYAETIVKNLPSVQPEYKPVKAEDKRELAKAITAGIIATNTKDVYSCGMRNGMRWCRALVDDKRPEFEDASQYIPKTFKVIDVKTGKEADPYEIALHEDWANDLMYCDMEGFAILEDGSLILTDECGRFKYCPEGRFEVRWE